MIRSGPSISPPATLPASCGSNSRRCYFNERRIARRAEGGVWRARRCGSLSGPGDLLARRGRRCVRSPAGPPWPRSNAEKIAYCSSSLGQIVAVHVEELGRRTRPQAPSHHWPRPGAARTGNSRLASRVISTPSRVYGRQFAGRRAKMAPFRARRRRVAPSYSAIVCCARADDDGSPRSRRSPPLSSAAGVFEQTGDREHRRQAQWRAPRSRVWPSTPPNSVAKPAMCCGSIRRGIGRRQLIGEDDGTLLPKPE